MTAERHGRRQPDRSKGTDAAPRGRRPKLAEPADTRESILDAAEALFSEHGFYGVTVREVARMAGVDPALLHYYFDTKRGLFDAAFERRAKILNQERVASLEAYEAEAGDGMTIEGCLAAFLHPMMVRWTAGDPHWKNYFRLVAVVNNTADWGGETMGRYFNPAIQQLIARFRKVMPWARDEDLYWSWNFISGALTLAFADTGRLDKLSEGYARSGDVPAIEARMAPFMAAGVEEICRRGAGRAG